MMNFVKRWVWNVIEKRHEVRTDGVVGYAVDYGHESVVCILGGF